VIEADPVRQGALLSRVRVRGFRSLIDVTLRAGAVTALVGEAKTGKSNLLAAIRALMDPRAPQPTSSDVCVEGAGLSHLDGELADGRRASLSGAPPRFVATREGVPPVLVLLRRSGAAACRRLGCRREAGRHRRARQDRRLLSES
jgi:hypothetical protein